MATSLMGPKLKELEACTARGVRKYEPAAALAITNSLKKMGCSMNAEGRISPREEKVGSARKLPVIWRLSELLTHSSRGPKVVAVVDPIESNQQQSDPAHQIGQACCLPTRKGFPLNIPSKAAGRQSESVSHRHSKPRK